jgi:hypothetical protein
MAASPDQFIFFLSKKIVEAVGRSKTVKKRKIPCGGALRAFLFFPCALGKPSEKREGGFRKREIQIFSLGKRGRTEGSSQNPVGKKWGRKGYGKVRKERFSFLSYKKGTERIFMLREILLRFVRGGGTQPVHAEGKRSE